LVIEDDTQTARYILSGLREAGFAAAHRDNGLDGLDLAINEAWDIIILDRMLPGQVDGLAIVDKLRSLGKQTPVLVISALTQVDERVRGLRSGADDYLSKPFAFSELLARVEVLLRRAGDQQHKTQLQVADLVLDLPAFRATRAGVPIALQPREFRLLEYLMRNTGKTVTRTMLLEAVWDMHFDTQTNVLDVQISRLRNKIDREFALPLIHTVRGVGYRFGIDSSLAP